MKLKLAVATGVLAGSLTGCAGFMSSDAPSDADKKQDAALKDPMNFGVNPPKSIDEGSPFKDLNDALFMP